MKKQIAFLAIAALVSANALASCIGGPVFSANKALHFAGTAAISGGVTAWTGSATAGFWTGIAAGALREVYKEHHGGRCEYSSMAYDLAGAAAGSLAVQHWFLMPKRGGAEIVYTRTF